MNNRLARGGILFPCVNNKTDPAACHSSTSMSGEIKELHHLVKIVMV